MNKKISENQIAYVLAGESKYSLPKKDFQQSLEKGLSKKLKSNISLKLFNFSFMKNKPIKFKIAVIIPLILLSLLSVTAALNPSRAKEVVNNIKKCGVSIDCYHRISETKNSYGDKVIIEERLDEQGAMRGKSVAISLETNKKIIEKLEGKIIKEDSEKYTYELISGSIVEVGKGYPSVVTWIDGYQSEFNLWNKEVFGEEYDSQAVLKERAEIYTYINSIEVDKLTYEEKITFFKRLNQVKMPNDTVLSSLVYSHKGKGYIYLAKPEEPNIKILDSNTKELIVEFSNSW